MEWIRSTLLLTVVIIGANLLKYWYISAVTALYGIAVFLYAHIVYASDKGSACKSSQEYRYQWLMWEIIFFWTFFFFFQFPMIVFRLCDKKKLSQWLQDDEDEEED